MIGQTIQLLSGWVLLYLCLSSGQRRKLEFRCLVVFVCLEYLLSWHFVNLFCSVVPLKAKILWNLVKKKSGFTGKDGSEAAGHHVNFSSYLCNTVHTAGAFNKTSTLLFLHTLLMTSIHVVFYVSEHTVCPGPLCFPSVSSYMKMKDKMLIYMQIVVFYLDFDCLPRTSSSCTSI